MALKAFAYNSSIVVSLDKKKIYNGTSNEHQRIIPLLMHFSRLFNPNHISLHIWETEKYQHNHHATVVMLSLTRLSIDSPSTRWATGRRRVILDNHGLIAWTQSTLRTLISGEHVNNRYGFVGLLFWICRRYILIGKIACRIAVGLHLNYICGWDKITLGTLSKLHQCCLYIKEKGT